jgi:hypothetical protein
MGHLGLDCRDPGRLISILVDGSRAPWCDGRLESPRGSIVLASCRSTRAGFQQKLRPPIRGIFTDFQDGRRSPIDPLSRPGREHPFTF